jgi:hypothetical protein
VSDELSAVMGASTTVKTMADGSLLIAIDIEPRHAQAAFALFGSPGTPVALARITNAAAVEQDRKEQAETDHGKHYAVLYKSGWFHNPKVSAAFGLNVTPDKRIEAIKDEIYGAFDVDSLTDISPESFIQWCDELGIRSTLPAAFGGGV